MVIKLKQPIVNGTNTLNILIHVTILFTILTLFFTHYVRLVAADAINGEISHIIEEVVHKSEGKKNELKNNINKNTDSLFQLGTSIFKEGFNNHEYVFEKNNLEDMARNISNIKQVNNMINSATQINNTITSAKELNNNINKPHNNINQIYDTISTANELKDNINQIVDTANELKGNVNIKQIVDKANELKNVNIKQIVNKANELKNNVNIKQIIDKANELKDNVNIKQINDTMNNAKQLNDTINEAKDTINEAKDKINNNFSYDYYVKLFSKEDDKRAKINDQILFYMKMTNILIVIMLMLFTYYLLKTKSVNIGDVKHLLFENVLTFIFIGVIEYFFFTRVALKFIPAPPSLIAKSFITALNDELN
jgi:hypothetical protein